MSRLILIEGLPGTGKTTTATRITEQLRESGADVRCYLEGDLHPVDTQWMARLTPTEDARLVEALRSAWEASPRSERWGDILARKEELSTHDHGGIWFAWTKMNYADTELWETAQQYRQFQVTDGQAGLDEFKRIYTNRWRAFSHELAPLDQTVVTESALFQSHIIELLGWYQCSDEEIVSWLLEIIASVRQLHPEIHYLHAENYPRVLLDTGNERPGWPERAIEWVEQSSYGKSRGLQGLDGAMVFFEHRARIERRVLLACDAIIHVTRRD